jgi:hypothetical protein
VLLGSFLRARPSTIRKSPLSQSWDAGFIKPRGADYRARCVSRGPPDSDRAICSKPESAVPDCRSIASRCFACCGIASGTLTGLTLPRGDVTAGYMSVHRAAPSGDGDHCWPPDHALPAGTTRRACGACRTDRGAQYYSVRSGEEACCGSLRCRSQAWSSLCFEINRLGFSARTHALRSSIW